MKRAYCATFTAIAILLAGCAAKQPPAAPESPAPLFNDLGSHHHPITTASPQAQRYFDQGLTLAFAFNHLEAARSFREATHLDPSCAMCFWGIALVAGPNINAAMDPATAPEAYEASARAQSLAAATTPREQAYIAALAQRYVVPAPESRASLDAAYADAMREVVRQYPDDLDAATLFAEAVMDQHPWDYWNPDGTAQPWTPEIVETLETVIERDPNHPGAIHFYIHATEASPDPGRAAPYADRLGDLVPGAGHLVHMPAHTYMRIGRYQDAVEANVRATKADDSYVTQCRAQGVYPLAYVPHNHHFLNAAASMQGSSAVAVESARMTDAKTHHELMGEPGMGALQHYSLVPLYTDVRFGRWDAILATPAPPEQLRYPTGIWHYARGRAFAAKGQIAAAERELEEVRSIAQSHSLEKITIWEVNSAHSLIEIAAETLAGEIAAAQRKWPVAIAHLEKAVQLEDRLRYQEPADWQYPVRHSLGAVLLAAGKPRQAEAVYREDLKRNPENGWALHGLAQSLRAQRKDREAAEVEARFRKAWAHADISIASSRL